MTEIELTVLDLRCAACAEDIEHDLAQADGSSGRRWIT